MKLIYSTPEDLPLVKKLWEDVFGDNGTYIDQFFHHLYQRNILTCKIDEEVASMAVLLPASILVERKEHKMRYVYACATAPKFRRMKLMSKLLDKAFEDVTQQGETGLFLLPANEELYDFYETNGFCNFFYHDQQRFSFPLLTEKIDNSYKIVQISAEKYQTLRHRYLHNDGIIHYPVEHFRFIGDPKINYPAKFYEILCQGKNVAIGFMEKRSDAIIAKEFLAKKIETQMLHAICHQLEKEQIILNTPGKTYRDAMLRSQYAPLFQKEISGYFNLALD